MRSNRMMGLIGMAAAMSAASLVIDPRPRLSKDEPVRIDDEKTSRQRKRWLQKQARKQQRKHSR